MLTVTAILIHTELAVAFALQQWSGERATTLRHTYIILFLCVCVCVCVIHLTKL